MLLKIKTLKSESNVQRAEGKLDFFAERWHNIGQIKKQDFDKAIVEYLINAKAPEVKIFVHTPRS